MQFSFLDSCATFNRFKTPKINHDRDLTTTTNPPTTTTYETTEETTEETTKTLKTNGLIQCPEQHVGHSVCLYGSCYLLLGEIVCHCQEGYGGVHCHEKQPQGNYHSLITIRKDLFNSDAQLEKTISQRSIEVIKTECEPEFSEMYCFNEGKCVKIELHRKKRSTVRRYYECECIGDFGGDRCNEKLLDGRYRRRRRPYRMIKSTDHASRKFFDELSCWVDELLTSAFFRCDRWRR